jgi:hypothetical protein
MEGTWAMNQAMFRISPSASDPQALTFSALTPDGWAPHTKGLRLRTDGRFHAARSANSMYTMIAGGRRCLVNTSVGGYGHFRDSALLAQKLRPGEALSAASQSRVGNLWLAVNEQPDSSTYGDDGGLLLAVGDIPGLAGYVTVTTGPYGNQVVDPGVSDALGAMFLQIPGFGSRDREERGRAVSEARHPAAVSGRASAPTEKPPPCHVFEQVALAAAEESGEYC